MTLSQIFFPFRSRYTSASALLLISCCVPSPGMRIIYFCFRQVKRKDRFVIPFFRIDISAISSHSTCSVSAARITAFFTALLLSSVFTFIFPCLCTVLAVIFMFHLQLIRISPDKYSVSVFRHHPDIPRYDHIHIAETLPGYSEPRNFSLQTKSFAKGK